MGSPRDESQKAHAAREYADWGTELRRAVVDYTTFPEDQTAPSADPTNAKFGAILEHYGSFPRVANAEPEYTPEFQVFFDFLKEVIIAAGDALAPHRTTRCEAECITAQEAIKAGALLQARSDNGEP